MEEWKKLDPTYRVTWVMSPTVGWEGDLIATRRDPWLVREGLVGQVMIKGFTEPITVPLRDMELVNPPSQGIDTPDKLFAFIDGLTMPGKTGHIEDTTVSVREDRVEIDPVDSQWVQLSQPVPVVCDLPKGRTKGHIRAALWLETLKEYLFDFKPGDGTCELKVRGEFLQLIHPHVPGLDTSDKIETYLKSKRVETPRKPLLGDEEESPVPDAARLSGKPEHNMRVVSYSQMEAMVKKMVDTAIESAFKDRNIPKS